MIDEQEYRLWQSRAAVYAPEGYKRYLTSLREAKDHLIKEKARFSWFRDYESLQPEFRKVLDAGNALQAGISEQKERERQRISSRITLLKARIATLRDLTGKINEGRLARKDLVKAELLLREAEGRHDRSDYRAAEKILKDASAFLKASEEAILPVLSRYTDPGMIKKWRQMAEETVAESRSRGIPAIVVIKSERLLILYKNGAPFKKYDVGLGRNGSLDKQYAGDNSTPEGKYRIIKKTPSSPFHRSLLINYPNEEDKRNFRRAKAKGLIPARVGIGGLIEIHGGGKDSVTYGCIALDNPEIDEVFKNVAEGTPVTIVGAVDIRNTLSSAAEGL